MPRDGPTERTPTKMRTQHVMLDHPGWMTGDDSVSRRAVCVGDTVWLVAAAPGHSGTDINLCRVRGDGAEPRFDVFDPAELRGSAVLAAPLRQDGTVARLANPASWDAVATAIIRQVIRAGQARKLYRLLSVEHGETVTTTLGSAALFPTAETVLALPDVEFTRLGLAFKRAPLRAAAKAYLDPAQKWTDIMAWQLIEDLQAIPRVGQWTARATVTDLTNDYTFYDYSDLAVRRWAARLTPDHPWPDDPAGFARAWEVATREQRSAWTALTLAWGVRHAHGTAL